MTLELERINDRFDIKDIERYSKETNTLCEIIRNLKFLLNRSELLTNLSKDENQKHHEHFNEKTDEYIKSMLRYVVKQQKELVDDMYKKLELDQIIDGSDISNLQDLPELPQIPKLDENK